MPAEYSEPQKVSLPRNHSAAEVAHALGESERYVLDKCRAREWPHRRGARGRATFTADDFARILELIAEPEAAPTPRGLAFAPRSGRRAS